jgi:DNA mismatch endonuclease, patch repair protein
MHISALRGGSLNTHMDRISPSQRSWNMSRIPSKNTKPELSVRRFLYANGLRYRLHGNGLPGRPDLVFKSRKVCVFVHGCFWHGCKKCRDGMRKVKTNRAFWNKKVIGNRLRDSRNVRTLREYGWRVLTIWECETSDSKRLGELAGRIVRASSLKCQRY